MEFHHTIYDVAQGASQVASAHDPEREGFEPVSKTDRTYLCLIKYIYYNYLMPTKKGG